MNDPKPTFQENGQVGGSRPILTRWLHFLAAVIGGVFILWFLTLLAFLRYVPSHEWLQAIEPYYKVIGATAVVITAVVLLLSFQAGGLQRVHRENESMILILPIFIAFLIYFPAAELMRRGIPAMISVVWGERIEHQFYILDPDERSSGRSHCRREIVLRDMNFTTKLCNMPSEFHDQLKPRMPVIFIGKGTWMGLFVEDFRKP